MSSLSKYVKTQPPKKMQEWADLFGVSRPYLYGLMDGTRSPSLETARRIDLATGGQVPLSSWPNIAAVLKAAGQAAE